MANGSTFYGTDFLHCAGCDAFYHVIKMTAGPYSGNHHVNCSNCGAVFQSRDGHFVLKYIRLRQTVGPQKRRRRAYRRRTGIRATHQK